MVHEWGTFTSFSGSDGVPVGFQPNNSDLPDFVYRQEDPGSKVNLLRARGTVSLETPVIYLYADRETRASVRVVFPKGWITEWYPFAALPPKLDETQSIRWDVRALTGRTVAFPQGRESDVYFHARATNADPLEADVALPNNQQTNALRGATLVQREKFLFYRGVGTFPPPVTLRALGQGRVRVTNPGRGAVGGLVLATVRDKKVGFRTIGELAAGAETVVAIADATGRPADLGDVMVKELTVSGLYPAEARAMVKTWSAAWFGEDGTRLLYLVPRARTDELLPLTVEPRPTEVVRVLVGRHDFLTPEQEVSTDQHLARARAARAELDAAEKELQALGRFSPEARALAEKRHAAISTLRR
ncbi:hypothetical protein FRUB_07602 [Fimbriiglobus ruber]|uniref:Uncharacterized protein n=1 Tax=Fimbriiglobus ruber TaxID=1908690 RepID=A0A225DAK0_9BACT|nr:hypothetical protein FRUB_07602 [Fimbriiglobus ruber]